MALGGKEPLRYTDILGLQQKTSLLKLVELIQPAVDQLAKEISDKIVELNGQAPSAVFFGRWGQQAIRLASGGG